MLVHIRTCSAQTDGHIYVMQIIPALAHRLNFTHDIANLSIIDQLVMTKYSHVINYSCIITSY